jgi:hypothetical protein
MKVSILLAAVGFFLFLGACSQQHQPKIKIREALLDRSSLQESIYQNPYEALRPAPRPVSWIEGEPDAGPTVTSKFLTDSSQDQKQRSGLCTSVEYPSDGRVTTADHQAFQRLLSGAKDVLMGWIQHHKAKFPATTYEALRNQIRSLRLGEPGPSQDPDITHRGIGVWTKDKSGPIVRVGPGFATLLKKNPERARFEMIRLAAQGWSPCELQKLGAAEPWSAYLRCMGIPDSETGCGAGDYSEAGWAVSSAVASVLAKPSKMGCTLPAFADDSHAECPRNFLLPLVIGGEKISLRSMQ